MKTIKIHIDRGLIGPDKSCWFSKTAFRHLVGRLALPEDQLNDFEMMASIYGWATQTTPGNVDL